MGRDLLREGIAAVRQIWHDSGRTGQPRIATGRYFGLGDNAETIADDYIRHYYGDASVPVVRADTLTTAARLHDELQALEEAGTTDVILYPTSGGIEQVNRLADALQKTGHL
jgi:hypothetical protein